MKKIKYIFIGLIILITGVSYSKDLFSLNRFSLVLGSNYVDNSSFYPKNFRMKYFKSMYPVSKLDIKYSLINGLVFDLNAGIFKMSNNSKWSGFKNNTLLKGGLGFNFHPLLEKYRVDPYIKTGANYHMLEYDHRKKYNSNHSVKLNKKHFFIVDGGVGLNLWITKRFGLNLESNYNLNPFVRNSQINFFQHSAGLAYRFYDNSSSDNQINKNKNRIINNTNSVTNNKRIKNRVKFIDECDIVNLNGGCRDYDFDNVPDKTDNCPTIFGLKKFNGCTDVDKDQTPDNIDSCPKQYGLLRNSGCPVPVMVKFKKEEKNISKKDILKTINTNFKNVLFNYRKSSIRNLKSRNIVKNISNLIIQNIPDSTIYIDGCIDNFKNSNFNRKLYLERANIIKNILIQNGVNKQNLVIKKFLKNTKKRSNKIQKRMNKHIEISIKN